jgi:hypothetical protein
LRCGDRRVFSDHFQQEDRRSDATAELTGTPIRKDYASRSGALIWFYRKGRDRWKRKHQDLNSTVKGFRNQIAAVTKSREQWRLKAERSSERVSASEAEIRELRAQAAVDKKARIARVAGKPSRHI